MNWPSRPPAAWPRATDARRRNSKVIAHECPIPRPPADPIDARLVRRLADILNDTGLTEIEVERGDLRISVARELTGRRAGPAALPRRWPRRRRGRRPRRRRARARPSAGGEVVKSPMVGTVYLQPAAGRAAVRARRRPGQPRARPC